MDKSPDEKLWALVQQERLVDTAWIQSLEEDDEPPFFTRDNQIGFLEEVNDDERGPLVVRVSIRLLQAVKTDLARRSFPDGQRIFCCVTLSRFDVWKTGERPIPTPALYVDPHHENASEASRSFISPRSQDGLQVLEWMAQLDQNVTQQFCVAELDSSDPDPDRYRVYIGWRSNPSKQIESAAVGF